MDPGHSSLSPGANSPLLRLGGKRGHLWLLFPRGMKVAPSYPGCSPLPSSPSPGNMGWEGCEEGLVWHRGL